MEHQNKRMVALMGNQVPNITQTNVDRGDEVIRFRRGAAKYDQRRWLAGIRTEILEFHKSLQQEEFLVWVLTVEEILEFKGLPKDKHLPLVATRLRNRATAWWWKQLKLT